MTNGFFQLMRCGIPGLAPGSGFASSVLWNISRKFALKKQRVWGMKTGEEWEAPAESDGEM